MKSAFISASYEHRAALAPALAAIRSALRDAGWDVCVFVEDYAFAPADQREMMQVTQNQLRQSDLLIAEVTHKAIGVGIEVGFAAALGLPIITVRHAEAEPSTTVGGLAACTIIYDNTNGLECELVQAIRQIFSIPANH